MLRVEQEDYLVILDFCGRRRDFLLQPDDARRLADALEEAASGAELVPSGMVKGEQWDVKIKSFDGFVAIRLDNHEVGLPDHMPMPPRAARQIASLLRSTAEQAELKIRIEVLRN